MSLHPVVGRNGVKPLIGRESPLDVLRFFFIPEPRRRPAYPQSESKKPRGVTAPRPYFGGTYPYRCEAYIKK